MLGTSLPGAKLFSRGKVRDVYDVSEHQLLIVATDRLSAFDVVMGEGIADKGRVLTQLSRFWFDFLRDFVPTHFLTTDVGEYPAELQKFTDQLAGRSMLVKKTRPFPIECVVRGYLAGSGWKDYQTTGEICGIRLPTGLRESAKLAQPIFTPATKAESGHDENVSFAVMSRAIGEDLARTLRDMSIRLYEDAWSYAMSKGLILADTKFEWGHAPEGELILIDEVLTPDSSRFWPADEYKVGISPPSFDKQFVRDWLETTPWDKNSPPPELPAEVVEKTRQKYREAYLRLVGKELPDAPG